MPFRLDGVDRVDDTPAHEALREAIVNDLTNANWFDRRGVICVWNDEAIIIANPGGFRMPIEEARKPGSTDPRNEAMMRIFAMVEIGERAGSGMDKIFGGWKWADYGEPRYDVAFGPDRTTLTLPLVSAADRTGKAVDSGGRFRTEATETARQAILSLLSGADTPLKSSEIAVGIGLGKTRTSELLRGLTNEGLVVADGAARSRVYRRASDQELRLTDPDVKKHRESTRAPDFICGGDARGMSPGQWAAYLDVSAAQRLLLDAKELVYWALGMEEAFVPAVAGANNPRADAWRLEFLRERLRGDDGFEDDDWDDGEMLP